MITSNEPVGLLKRGTIIGYIKNRGILQVKLNNASTIKGSQSIPVDVQAPHSLFYNNGLFIGTLPVEGTPVIVGQGQGGKYYFVSFLAEDLPKVPSLTLGELLIQSNDDTYITLDVKDNITIGSSLNNIHINTVGKYISTNFHNEYNFTQASRKVVGVVKRDTIFFTQFSQESKLEKDDYDSKFEIIGLDPGVPATTNITGSDKNPPFVENRELIYEFQYASSIKDDLHESSVYGLAARAPTNFTFPNRRISRSDTLSLSLVAPNYLIETIKGTVVDIFGNLLDLNRDIIPVGQGQATIREEQSTDKIKSFFLIKELERKSLAYHFEINARKDLTSKIGNNPTLPDVNSNDDYSRSRSRFFLDIDKEGQFKLNVPSSSEKGNVPLLTRYENYSTFGTDDNNNPHKLVYRSDDRDIYQDSFASRPLTTVLDGFKPTPDESKGSIRLIGEGGDAAPKDRITKQVIKHGTAYHDIMQTCFVHQNNNFLNYQAGEVDPLTINLSLIPELKNIASDTIITSGAKANAGGRSGSLNFDGSVELNIGANTVDRQSMWLDTAGGIVANIGKDRNGRSILAATDGDFYLQVGSYSVMGDSRFPDTGNKSGVLDLRILGKGGFCHMIRVDDNGITIMTPGNLGIHSKGDMTLTSDKNIRIECTTLILQERVHMKGFGGSS